MAERITLANSRQLLLFREIACRGIGCGFSGCVVVVVVIVCVVMVVMISVITVVVTNIMTSVLVVVVVGVG